MNKKKISRNVKRRLTFFGPFVIVILVFCLVSIFSCLYRIQSLKSEEKNLTRELTELKEKEEDLTGEIARLKDPDYIAKYARENYYYTKNGEYVIKMDDDSNNQTSIDKVETHKSYYVISIALLILILLLVILRKVGKKR